MSKRLNQENAFDVLGDILETLRFRGSIFFRSDLAAPWGMSLNETGTPRFHIMMAGECYVGAEGHDAVAVHESDIVMLPNGNSHWIADQPDRKLIPSAKAGAACELGNPLFQDGEITNRLICGTVNYEQGASHPILNALPEVMHFHMLGSTDSIWSIVTLIDSEMRAQEDQSSRITDRLTEVLFLKLLNHFVANDENAIGFLAALRDRRVYRALELIHQEPEFGWSLATLGVRVGMSRATLVRRFQDVVGVAPMAYIMDWRIMKAHNMVKYSTISLEQIADSTGFASARTLTRTFQRHYDCTPTELRRSSNNQ